MIRSNCSWLTCGPCVVSGSNGSPTFVFFTLLEHLLDELVVDLLSTNSRLPAQQHWPWLKNSAKCDPSAAASRSASAKTMFGLLPPSSSVTRLRFVRAAACMISLPTSVLPVNATLSTSMCSAIAAPAVSPKPGTMLMTPSGKPASMASSPTRRRRQRRLLGGLQHDRAAGRQRRAPASTPASAAGSSTG